MGQQTINCKRCGDRLELLAVIPRFVERPAYKIYSCNRCDVIEWLADRTDSPMAPATARIASPKETKNSNTDPAKI
jgi:hypothetical protein